MKIPYVVIVQPHLLREKSSVRLRRIQFDGSNNNLAEQYVSLENLAATILAAEDDSDHHAGESNNDGDVIMTGVGAQTNNSSRSSSSPVECVYVETDQFWGSEKQITKSDSPNWRSILKSLKSVSQRSEVYLDSMSDVDSSVVIASELPFWVLREFGTILMRRGGGESTATMASMETTERYPRHKRILKTLATAIDATMKKHGYWTTATTSTHHKGQSSSSSKRGLLTLFLYSKIDDRFDMIGLGDEPSHVVGQHKHASPSRRRNDRRKG